MFLEITITGYISVHFCCQEIQCKEKHLDPSVVDPSRTIVAPYSKGKYCTYLVIMLVINVVQTSHFMHNSV